MSSATGGSNWAVTVQREGTVRERTGPHSDGPTAEAMAAICQTRSFAFQRRLEGGQQRVDAVWRWVSGQGHESS